MWKGLSGDVTTEMALVPMLWMRVCQMFWSISGPSFLFLAVSALRRGLRTYPLNVHHIETPF